VLQVQERFFRSIFATISIELLILARGSGGAL